MGEWAPKPKLTVTQWANRYRKLSAESSAAPGDYNSDNAPYQAGPQDAVSDRRTEMVVLMWGSQLGKSEIENNICGYFMAQEPSPILILQPTIEAAEDYSKDRIFPMIRDTPVLRKLFDLFSRSGSNTLRHKLGKNGCNVTLVGANSPAGLASRPKKVLLGDELDRFPRSAGEEGDPWTLAERRLATFLDRIKIAVSTPTVKGQSKIEELWEASDKRRYFIECPHCKERVTFQFRRLSFDPQNPKDVSYLCQECDAEIDEKMKMFLLRGGKWIAEKPFEGIAGFHLNELYSPWRKWAEIVKDFLVAKKSPHTLRAWTNTSLAELWEEKGDAPEYKRLYERREKYKAQVPGGALFLTAGVDLQKDRIEVQIVGWGRNGERWLIDYRILWGEIQLDKPWNELDEILNEYFEHESGNTMMIKVMAIDTGTFTQRAYNYIRKKPSSRVLAVKGRPDGHTIIAASKSTEMKKDGRKVPRGLKLWLVGTGVAKTELLGCLKVEKPTDEELVMSDGQFPSNYHHFPLGGEGAYSANETYFQQLTAEALIQRTEKGITRMVWVQLQDRNEGLDTAVYARAAAEYYGISRFKEKNWLELEAAYPLSARKPRAIPVPSTEAKAPNPPAPAPRPQRPQRRRGGYLNR